jgi:hypothetical protein
MSDPVRMSGPPAAPSGPAESAPGARIAKGANWGALAGLVAALLLVRKLAPHGHYSAALLIFAICIALGAAIGIGYIRLKDRRP